MHFDTFIRSSVGADLSRPPPMYRPRWMFRYPDENVKKHNRTLYTLPSPPQLTGCRDNRYNLQEILSGGERKVK